MAKNIIGAKVSMGPGCEAGDVAEPAPLHDGDGDAVGGADRQQVHDHGLERHEQRCGTPTIISRNDTTSTATKKYGIRELRQVARSRRWPGTCPVTATSLPSAASPSTSTSSRRRCTSSVVASSCGEVFGRDEPPVGGGVRRGRWAAAGDTKTTPGSAATASRDRPAAPPGRRRRRPGRRGGTGR